MTTTDALPPEEGDRLVQLIAAGRFDDRIADVVEAVQQRFLEEAVAVAWSISDADVVMMTEQDMTVAEAEQWQRKAGFADLAALNLRDPRHYRALKSIALQRTGLSEVDADARAGGETLAEMVANIGQVQVPPIAAASSDS